ncbi:MAG: three-Cys-motif partner protein TcmP [Allosphingosinicella sp.]|uniref:three-Cys-motif partner protein TcmP n=1 Tax=Allosphingosinicella sp. TaxID=2823234 RepID=UPI003963EF12
MEAQSFGDKHTVRKLETVHRYLQTYTTALKFQRFELLYVDACAGSGSSVPRGALEPTESIQVRLDGFAHPVADTDEIIVGSAIRALGVNPPFHKYLLNDVKQSNVDALRKAVRQDFPHLADRVELTRLDANEMLRNLCTSTDWKETRAVVFLDPFGLQIDYSTLELLGQTKAVDLWYLVPVFAMYRQVSGEGQINPDGGPRVDAALGTDAWRHVVVVEERSTDLFNQSHCRSKRAVDIAWFEKVAKERLGEAFGGRVLDETLPLGRNGIQEFSLMFAWANPGEKAKLAAKLAKAVLA